MTPSRRPSAAGSDETSGTCRRTERRSSEKRQEGGEGGVGKVRKKQEMKKHYISVKVGEQKISTSYSPGAPPAASSHGEGGTTLRQTEVQQAVVGPETTPGHDTGLEQGGDLLLLL